MRVLITGSRGQVGRSLRDRLPEEWELIATDSKTLDITDADKVNTMITSFQPDVIINTAAYTNVEQAEKDHELAFAVNALGVKNIAKAAQKNGARFIHLSTDYVFDGNKNGEYTEDDFPNPINAYGQSKLAGELLALANCGNTLIIRTSSIFSEYGNNFVKQIIEKARNNETININTDGKARPTYAGDLANVIIQHIEKKPTLSGIIHVGGNEALTWYDFARLILDNLSSSVQLTHHIDENPTVKRPANSTLQVREGFESLQSLKQHVQSITDQ